MKSLEVTSLNTAKSIFDHQNDTFLLRCLSAQRCVYSRAKLAAQLKTVFTISFAVVSATASILDIDWLSASASLMAVALLIFNKYSDGYIASRKKQAASVQQYIDATLYAAAIHCDISDWGDIPEKSELAATVSKYENTDTSDMKNWYSNYSGLPVEEQVFRCQSENISWDYCLHKSFRTLQIFLLTVVVIVMLAMSIITNPTFVKIICIMSWFVPIAEYAYSTYKEVDNTPAIKFASRADCKAASTPSLPRTAP